MKINKYGKVVISEDEVLVTEFEVEEIGLNDLRTLALLWAIKQIVDEMFNAVLKYRPKKIKRITPDIVPLDDGGLAQKAQKPPKEDV